MYNPRKLLRIEDASDEEYMAFLERIRDTCLNQDMPYVVAKALAIGLYKEMEDVRAKRVTRKNRTLDGLAEFYNLISSLQTKNLKPYTFEDETSRERIGASLHDIRRYFISNDKKPSPDNLYQWMALCFNCYHNFGGLINRTLEGTTKDTIRQTLLEKFKQESKDDII